MTSLSHSSPSSTCWVGHDFIHFSSHEWSTTWFPVSGLPLKVSKPARDLATQAPPETFLGHTLPMLLPHTDYPCFSKPHGWSEMIEIVDHMIYPLGVTSHVTYTSLKHLQASLTVAVYSQPVPGTCTQSERRIPLSDQSERSILITGRVN